MSLGSNLFDARKKKGLSQETVAEKLGVSRQTISKWETDETLPDIRQSRHLEVQEIQEVIDRTREEVSDKIDWTKAWSKKYPVLTQYQTQVDAAPYVAELERLLENLKKDYGYNELDAFLVLKDILARVWKARKGS